MLKKHMMNFRVNANDRIHSMYGLMRLTPANGERIPDLLPGQFVQVAVPDSPTTFLRRPISINFVDRKNNELWLLIRKAGEGTRHLIEMQANTKINIILPLGNTFTIPEDRNSKLLLVGGGVGVAPMLYFGAYLRNLGYDPEFLIGARTASDVLELDSFNSYGKTNITTEDGSLGKKGLVTSHPAINSSIDFIYCCGPAPMMKAVSRIAKEINVPCEVSLENMMACGLGACLCCVEKTVRGNVCVCTEGPIFNTNELTW